MKGEERFKFGSNWKKYSELVDSSRIHDAEAAMQSKLGTKNIQGKSFLDIGCGSGLMSLAAHRMGANVFSFDYDLESVECTESMKERFAPDAQEWTIEQGSVLDSEYMSQLGKYDIVYSWGVLHHTGKMWDAIGNAAEMVEDLGLFYLAIYNDQGGYSARWKKVKQFYLRLPDWAKPVFAVALFGLRQLKPTLGQILRLKNPMKLWESKDQTRGMALWTDWLDWIGGYPFEVAKPEDIFYFCRDRGFTLVELVTCRGGLGCNEFVFRKDA